MATEPYSYLTPRDAAIWRGINKQTVYILSFKTNLNMDVFQIVFSVFSQPHQGQCLLPSLTTTREKIPLI